MKCYKKETKLKQIKLVVLTSIKIKNILYKKYLQKQDIFWYEKYKFYRNMIIFGSFFKIIFIR